MYVSNILSLKRFHGAETGNTHECLLKLSIGRVRLDLLPEIKEGLTDIEGFSHLFVLWLFDRAAGYDLLVTPPTATRPHGVFATRAPRRPNPIGLTVVQLLRREGPRLHVRGLDMVDGSPILDLKPYLSSVPAEHLQRGWLATAEARR